ncbi:MAG: biopolymer transporter ExbD [Sphingobacteriaceae bacterium]|nr:biopolymer transporter ExbD [Sphingobacteriaceae bacterium]
MNLKKRSKRLIEFSMSSMTDIVFLLLIFFMLTSTLVSPNALKLILPKSSGKTLAKQSISVSIDQDKQLYFNQDRIGFDELATRLGDLAATEGEEATVVLNAERSVPIEEVVKVMSIANKLKIKMILATDPE